MSKPKMLSISTRYWSKHESDGGLMTIRLRVYGGIEAAKNVAARAYHYDRNAPGAYFSHVLTVKHAKRNEYLVEVRFGWDY